MLLNLANNVNTPSNTPIYESPVSVKAATIGTETTQTVNKIQNPK